MKHIFPIRITVIGGLVVIFIGLFVSFLWSRSSTLKDEPTLPKLIQILHGRTERYRTWRAYGWAYEHMPSFLKTKMAPPNQTGVSLFSRIQAAQVLGELGPSGRPAVPSLARIIENREENPSLRLYCIQSLGNIGPSAKEALPVLRGILNGYQSPSGRFKKKSEKQNDLDEMQYWILERAVNSISKIGSTDQGTVNLVRSVSGITNRFVDVSAAIALWRLQPNFEGFLSVSNYLMMGPPPTRSQAVYILSQMGVAARPFKTILATLEHDHDESVRKAVGFALDQIQ